jgi:hypothetical protein
MVATHTLSKSGSDADIENLQHTYAKCRFKRWHRDGRPIPCRSQRCPSAACRRKYAEKEAAILSRSFRAKPPDYNLTLRLTDGQPTTHKQLAGYLKTLTQKFRDCRKETQATIEYHIVIEFTNGQPHMHMTIITSLNWSIGKMKAAVKQWWSSSCAGRHTTAVYCDRVRNVIGLANYLPKNLKDRRRVEMPPESWNSRTCRLVWSSRGFLAKPKADLWKDQCQEWYHQAAPAVRSVGPALRHVRHHAQAPRLRLFQRLVPLPPLVGPNRQRPCGGPAGLPAPAREPPGRRARPVRAALPWWRCAPLTGISPTSARHPPRRKSLARPWPRDGRGARWTMHRRGRGPRAP